MQPDTWDTPDHIQNRFDALHRAARAHPNPPWADRRDRLERLVRMLRDNEPQIVEAISRDFGQRAAADTQLAEIFPCYAEIAHALRHGHRWMAPRKVPTALWFKPGKSRIVPQPKGVVGIIGPWNYPLMLIIAPLAGTFAAGNRALVKTSEYAPHFANWLVNTSAQYFAPDELAVLRGGPEIGAAFSALPLDHLVFTGNGEVGKKVMQAASANLTPVTLELGGKSPAIVTKSADLRIAVDRIMSGKMLNAGQTCVAPDYVLIDRAHMEGFITRARDWMARRYPDPATNPDVTRIIDDRQFARLTRMVADARQGGAQIHPLTSSDADETGRMFAPVIVTGMAMDSDVMTREIFGPVLPVIPIDGPQDAVRHVTAGPRPLAAYYFSNDRSELEAMSRQIVSGGACFNETVMHVAQTNLPFGGVGASGMGGYHGQHGFDTFSHLRATFIQSRLNGLSAFAPPFGARFDRMLKALKWAALPRRLR